jgi:large subunit ribosomal protein L16
LESGRRAIARRVKKLGKVWVNVFPDLIVTAKPSETRIGKGKGRLDY